MIVVEDDELVTLPVEELLEYFCAKLIIGFEITDEQTPKPINCGRRHDVLGLHSLVLVALLPSIVAHRNQIEKAFKLEDEHGCFVRGQEAPLHIRVPVLDFKHKFERRSIKGVVSNFLPKRVASLELEFWLALGVPCTGAHCVSILKLDSPSPLKIVEAINGFPIDI